MTNIHCSVDLRAVQTFVSIVDLETCLTLSVYSAEVGLDTAENGCGIPSGKTPSTERPKMEGTSAKQRQQRLIFGGGLQLWPCLGQIFGILNQMKEEFETNLAKMQEEEKTAQTDFADLKTAKSAEIAGNKKMTKVPQTQ